MDRHSRPEFSKGAKQSDNKRNVPLYEIEGMKLTVVAIAKRVGVNYHTLRFRLRNGMSMQQAITHQKHQPIRSI